MAPGIRIEVFAILTNPLRHKIIECLLTALKLKMS